MPPTQAMPPPVVPPYGPPGAPPGPPPGAPGGPPPGSSNAKWFIIAGIGAVILIIAAFLLFRGDDNKSNVAASESSSQSSNTDNTDSTSSSSKSSKSSSKSSSSSSAGKETVDPNTVEQKLLKAKDIGSEFTDQTFTPSTQTTDPCGNPNARAQVPPTKDVGSTATEASQNLFFEEEVEFYKNANDTKKAFDIAVNSLKTCSQGTLTDSSGSTSSFSVSDTKDVSKELDVTKAIEFTVTAGDTTVIEVGARLDNCIATFTFAFPTSAGQSAVPDEIGISKDGIDRLLGR
jgi:cytoskeletal protein RodZ